MTPKVRKDGRCYVCKGERPFNPQKGVPPEAYLADPFCSSKCARTFFGTLEPLHASAKGDTSRHRGMPMKIRPRNI